MALGEERLPVSKNPIPGEAVPNICTGKGGSKRNLLSGTEGAGAGAYREKIPSAIPLSAVEEPPSGSPECGAIVASLPLSRTNQAILQQPLGFELTVPACLDSNQASATDPRSPELQPIRRWQ